MTNNQLTKEWLQQTIAELESVRDEIPFGIDTNSELELAAFKMALAAMDCEPVIIVGDDSGDALSYRRLLQSFAPGTKLYRHAQPARNVTRCAASTPSGHRLHSAMLVRLAH